MRREKDERRRERQKGNDGIVRLKDGKERKELENRIRRFVEEQDRVERERRRRNTVLKGAEWGEECKKGAVTIFIKENKRIEVELEGTQKMRVGEKNTIIIATLKSWEEKMKVMREKGKMGQGIYIDDDLTKKEREIQQRLRRIARVRREKGEYVKIGYKKLKIEGRWNESEEKLEEEGRIEVRGFDKEKEGGYIKGMKMCFWNVTGTMNKDKEV